MALLRHASRIPGICRAFEVGRGRAYGDGEVFYDSQSGRHMTIPGSRGIRINELCAMAHGVKALLALQGTRLTSFACSLAAMQQLLGSPGAGQAPAGKDPAAGSTKLIVPVESAAEARSLVAAQPASAALGFALQPLVAMALGPELDEGRLRQAGDLVRSCRQLGLEPRVLLKRAWSSGDDPDENLHASSLQEATAALADADACVLTLSDCLGQASDDSLREAIEAAFNIDVAGESMLERLALRLAPGEELCRLAMRLGVTRYDANACPHLGPPSSGQPCMLPEGACMCRQAGLGPVVGTLQLLAVAEGAGQKHRVDLGALAQGAAQLR